MQKKGYDWKYTDSTRKIVGIVSDNEKQRKLDMLIQIINVRESFSGKFANRNAFIVLIY